MSGGSFVEGYLTRSLDGRLLCLAAYGTNAGSVTDVTTATSVTRVVGTINGVSFFSRAIVSSTDYSGANFRSAVTDGTNNFWGAGAAGGTVYLGTSAPRAVVQNSKANCRVVECFNGNLYMSSASSIGDGLRGIYMFNGLPNSATSLPVPIIFTNTFTSPNGVNDFAVSPSGTTIYFADDRTPNGIEGGIQRWDFDGAHSVWVNSYRLANGLPGVGAGNLEVDWSGPSPVLYATTSPINQNQLVAVTDTGASSTFSILATAGVNQSFRGVKFGPISDGASIVTQPLSRTNGVGTTTTFVVGAAGTGPLAYQWRLNGTNIGGATLATFSIANVQSSDAGNYQVIASNPYGSATSAVATLTVRQPPVAVATVIGTRSGPPTLNVSFSGAGSYDPEGAGLGFLWTFGDGFTSTLSNPIHSYASNGVYLARLAVSDGFSTNTSTNIAITVTPAAFIAISPPNRIAASNYNVTMTVSASGSAPLTYQWFKNGVIRSGATTSSLVLNSVDASAIGNYTVVVSNSFGAVTSSPPAALSVEPPLKVLTLAGRAGLGGTNDGPGSAARFTAISAVAVDTNGTIYVADVGANTIRKVTASGFVTTFAGMPGVSGTNNGLGSNARFNQPDRLAVDGAGNVYVSDFGNGLVRKITAAGMVSTLPGHFTSPEGVAVDNAGNVYVAEYGSQTVRMISPGGAVTLLAGATGVTGSQDGNGANARFNRPNGLAADSAGNVYVADEFNFAIRKINQAGVVSTVAGLPSTSGNLDGVGATARFNRPVSVAVDTAGNVFEAEWVNNSIRKITPDGIVDTLAGFGPSGTNDETGINARFSAPNGVAVDAFGNVYIADRVNNILRKGIPNYGQPFIVGQPQNQTNATGTAAFLAVQAIGNPPLAYQWSVNGTNVSGGTNSNLNIPNAQVTDSGNYQVIVTNASGSATSLVAILSVGDAPAFTSQPQNQAAALGASASLSATVTGTPPLGYQWRFNGLNRAGATGSAISFLSVSLTDAGPYQLVATSPYGSVTSSVAVLSIFTPVNILQPPADAQVAVGSSVTFSVFASSSGALAYQWSFNGSNIAGATASSYTLNSAQLTDAGDYTVQVANAALATNATAALRVVALPPPPPPPVLSSYTIQIHTGLNLIANQLDAGLDTLHEIMPSVPNGTVVSKYDNTSGTWIQDTYHSASGSWIPGIVALRPGEGAFLLSPSNYALTFTGTAHVPVLPVSIPAGAAWLVSRQTNDVGSYENITGTSPLPGAVVYQWNPTNSIYTPKTYTGSGWSPSAPVAAVGESLWIAPAGGAPALLPDAPVITQQPSSVAVLQGGLATFTVLAVGSDLQYQWRLNENNLPGANGSSYTISNVQPSNAGHYSVVVYNLIGIAISTNVSLTVTDLPVLPPSNNFVDAADLGSVNNGSFSGSTLNANTEPGEPAPGNITGGASIWLRWHPSVSGQATFTTVGSDYDTLLAIYTGSTLANLHSVAADDDIVAADGRTLSICSSAGFNASAGTTYFIQIDGFYGASGHVVLSWSNSPTVLQAPEIVVPPQGQTLPSGATALLSVIATNTGSGVSYQWTHDGSPIASATSPTLTLVNVGLADAGLYRVSVTNTENGLGVISMAANIQIFDPGIGQAGNPANVALQDKFPAANDLTVPDPNFPRNPVDDAVLSGYGGTITAGGTGSYTVDPGETAHCGYAPHKSVWGNYSNNVSGRLTISTKGSTFNAVLSIYTGPDVAHVVQVPGGCSAGHGINSGESVTVDYTNSVNYRIVVQPVNTNDSGTVVLTYNLVANAGLASAPVSQIVTNGGKLNLNAVALGTPPLSYQWRFNGQDLHDGANMSGAHTNSLVISNFTSGLQGQYTLLTANVFSTNESAPALVYFGNPPQFISSAVNAGIFTAQMACLARSNYVIEASSDLLTWTTVKTSSDAFGFITFTDPMAKTNKFYRARKL
jgi:hypothetical protein